MKTSNKKLRFFFIYSKEEYRNGKWVNEDKCNETRELFEAIIPTIGGFFHSVNFDFFNGSRFEVPKHQLSQLFAIVDTIEYMRCYSSRFPTRNIARIEFQILKAARFFVHTPGMFFGVPLSAQRKVLPKIGRRSDFMVENEVHEALNRRESPCEETQIDRDACIKDQLHKEMMMKFNCTTPFEENKNLICRDGQIAKQALELYKEYQFSYNGSLCLKPCNHLRPRILLVDLKDTSANPKLGHLAYSIFEFESDVKKIKAYWVYSFLSLVAEFGGYVGLFLGFSVYQISEVFEKMMPWRF